MGRFDDEQWAECRYVASASIATILGETTDGEMWEVRQPIVAWCLWRGEADPVLPEIGSGDDQMVLIEMPDGKYLMPDECCFDTLDGAKAYFKNHWMPARKRERQAKRKTAERKTFSLPKSGLKQVFNG